MREWFVSFVDCAEGDGVSDLVEYCQSFHSKPLYNIGRVEAEATFEDQDPREDLLSIVE